MFIDTHCDAIYLQANIQRAKAGHGCVLLLISLFESMVSYCTIKGKRPSLTKKLMPCPQYAAKKQILIGVRLCAQMNPNGFNFTELCIIYFVTEISVSGNWKSMNWFKYYVKDGAITMGTFLWLKITFQHFPYVRGYDRAVLMNTFRPNHQEKDLEL